MSKSILTGPARSGGGATMNKNVRPPIRTGSPRQRNVTPDGAASIGRSVGNHASEGAEGGGYTTKRPNAPLYVEARAPVPLGNEVALNVGRGGPGAGRVVHQSGSQGQHGPAVQGSTPRPRDILSEFGPESKRR
jgi:hypothetical protein